MESRGEGDGGLLCVYEVEGWWSACVCVHACVCICVSMCIKVG